MRRADNPPHYFLVGQNKECIMQFDSKMDGQVVEIPRSHARALLEMDLMTILPNSQKDVYRSATVLTGVAWVFMSQNGPHDSRCRFLVQEVAHLRASPGNWRRISSSIAKLLKQLLFGDPAVTKTESLPVAVEFVQVPSSKG